MIAVAVVGLLAAVAYPSYLDQVRKSRRVEAKNALLDLASRQERHFSTRNIYASTPDALGYSPTAFPVDVKSSSQVYYQLNVAVSSPYTTFSATATPVGTQSTDKCGTYTINSLGQQGNTNATASDCW